MLTYKSMCTRSNQFTRFPVLAILSCFLSSVVFAQTDPTNRASNRASKDSANDITIHQEVGFKASPKQLYEILLSSKEFSECTKKSFDNFSATSANIDPTIGGAFSLFDGIITGRIIELVPGERIVEAWRAADWPPGTYSVVRFELKPAGSGTQLIFDHIGFPEGLKAHLTIGWQQHYWDALAKYLQ
ncbi:MAG: SRPBCC domain-containing protein [Sphingobacteriales bacterium]